MFILNRYYKFYKQNGLFKAIIKIITTPYRIVKKRIYQKNKELIFNQDTSEKRFNLIYKTNFWSSNESVSGYGSELKNTINIEKEIINKTNKLFKNNQTLIAKNQKKHIRVAITWHEHADTQNSDTTQHGNY